MACLLPPRAGAALATAACTLPRWTMAATALPGTLPLRRDPEPAAAGEPWSAVLLLLALALAAGMYLLRRRGGASGAGAASRRAGSGVARLSSQALTPQASVHTVCWNGEEYLLGCTAQQVTLLARRPLPPSEGESP
jgi:flagellar biogenesis protein FliO